MKQPTPHPVYPIPKILGEKTQGILIVDMSSDAAIQHLIEIPESDFLAKMQKREEIIIKAGMDPLNYGYEPQHWLDADAELESSPHTLCVFGGNRAGKTTWGIKRAIQKLVYKDNVDVLFLQNNELSSIQLHQKLAYTFLPMEWRKGKKTLGGNIRFDFKTGFSDNVFTTDRGGTAIFGNYSQDVEKYEGLQYDLIVADENMPLKWYLGLLRCLADRNGKLPWLFTPIDGVTPAITEVTTGARTIRSLPVDPTLLSLEERHVTDCEPGTMPYISKAGKVHIIYFHSKLNPFCNYQNLKDLYGTKSKEIRERRFYGFARKTSRVSFPKFGDANIVPHDLLLARISDAGSVSRYHVMDPAGRRNMFMLWIAVDAEDYHYVYREWPDQPRHGEWALPAQDARKWDGEEGPAQPSLGYTISDYKRLILTEESNRYDIKRGWDMCGEDIVRRLIDPRSGAADAIADRDGGSSIIARFEMEDVDASGIVTFPSLYFEPAPGIPETQGAGEDREGVQGINDLLGWDETQPLCALVNEPRLLISDHCENLIWALKNYTGNDGPKAACKDPIDCLRYAVTEKLQHYSADMMTGRDGGRF